MTSGNGDEKHEVNSLLEGGFFVPEKKLLCLPPSLAEELTEDAVRKIFKEPTSLPILMLHSEFPRPQETAATLASHIGLCRLVLVPELGSKMNVMLDNRAVIQFISDQLEELVIMVMDHYRILSFLQVFLRDGWEIQVPEVTQGIFIDPTTQRINPI